MQTVLIVIHLMIVSALVVVVLLQRSEGGALGIGGGGGFLTSRGQANVLTRATAILAAAFFVTSLLLSILAGWGQGGASLFDGPARAPVTQTPAGPQQPSPPLGSGQGGILPTLRQINPAGSATPPAPPIAGEPAAPAPAAPAAPAPAAPAPAAPAAPAQ